MTSQAGNMSNRPLVDPYSKVAINEGNLGLSGLGYHNQAQQNNLSMNVGYSITPQHQAYNIPVSSADPHYQYVQHSPYSDSQSPYNISQPSPVSEGIANMNIASPLKDQKNLDTLGQ